ncbi:hypothetical protein Tco_0452356 [Tanacetum coccineum]
MQLRFKTRCDQREAQLICNLTSFVIKLMENSLIYKEKTKKLHDSKIKNRIFNIGDQVLLFNFRLKIFFGKLKSRWSGPFTITEVYPYGTAKLSLAEWFRISKSIATVLSPSHDHKAIWRGYTPLVLPRPPDFPLWTTKFQGASRLATLVLFESKSQGKTSKNKQAQTPRTGKSGSKAREAKSPGKVKNP